MRAMRHPTVLAALAFSLTLSSVLGAQTTGVEIELSHNTPGEQSEAERLRNVLGQFDLTPWLFTRRVLIDEKAIPHSQKQTNDAVSELRELFPNLQRLARDSRHEAA